MSLIPRWDMRAPSTLENHFESENSNRSLKFWKFVSQFGLITRPSGFIIMRVELANGRMSINFPRIILRPSPPHTIHHHLGT